MKEEVVVRRVVSDDKEDILLDHLLDQKPTGRVHMPEFFIQDMLTRQDYD